jgi:hypothetical protein
MAASGQPGVYLLQEKGDLVEMLEQPYDSEELLQRLLSQHPSLLAGSQIDPDSPRKWLLITRECGIPAEQNGGDRWAVDHLFIDQDAIPTLVEVKRSTDTRIRREVVGQMLDYAANCIVHWPIETLRQRFDAQCEMDQQSPVERLAAFLGDEQTPEAFWQAVKTNLQAGRVRLLFVADQVPAELRRVVEFLNRQMDPAEVLAIEVRQYVGQGLKTLVPRVMGQTAEAEQKKGRMWDLDTFLQTLNKNCEKPTADLARRLHDWSQTAFGNVRFGHGAERGSFGPVLFPESSQAPFFLVRSDGRFTIRFMHIKAKNGKRNETILKQLIAQLNQIPGLTYAEDDVRGKPNRPLEPLLNPSHLKLFQEAVVWLRDELQRG